MSDEREAALDHFFEGAASERGAGDAVVEVGEALDALMAALAAGSALGDQYGTPMRKDADRAVRAAALALGSAAVDALRGLVLADVVTEAVMLRRSGMAGNAAPLDPGWQRERDSYAALGRIAAGQRERLTQLEQQPNQLYRRLHESVALAADTAAWTAWVAA